MKWVGFTLVELLITLVIVSILLVTAIPSFITLYQEHHLKTTVQQLYYVLKFAQSEARKSNVTVYANFGTGDNWCYGTNKTSTCTCSLANSCTLATYSRPRTQDLSLAVSGMTGNTIQFDGVHGATNSHSTVTFTIYNGSTSMGVVINAFGNIQLCSSQLSGYITCS